MSVGVCELEKFLRARSRRCEERPIDGALGQLKVAEEEDSDRIESPGDRRNSTIIIHTETHTETR